LGLAMRAQNLLDTVVLDNVSCDDPQGNDVLKLPTAF